MIVFGQDKVTWGNNRQYKIVCEILLIILIRLYKIFYFLYRNYSELNERYSRGLVLRHYKALMLLLLVISRPFQLKTIMHVNFWSRCATQYSTTKAGYWKLRFEMLQVFCNKPDVVRWLKEKKSHGTTGQFS